MMDEPQDEAYDVVIAGAGPAGSTAAIRLANAGFRVLIAEQKSFPRDKLCGEFISPECLKHFEELGVRDQIAAAGATDIRKTIFFSQSGTRLSVPSEWFGDRDSLALGLSRAEFDDILLTRARECGAEVLGGTRATGVRVEDGQVVGVDLKDDRRSEFYVKSRLVIDATGRTRSLASRFESSRSPRRPARYVAFKTHLRSALIEANACEIYAYRGGYGGLNRVEADLFNVCFIVTAADARRYSSNAETIMRQVVFTNPRAKSAMQNALIVKPFLAVPVERFGRAVLTPAKGMLTVGDSAAFIDPFTGSGILLALESSKILSEAITGAVDLASEFPAIAREYSAEYSRAFDARLRLCSMLRHVSVAPPLASAAILVLSKSGRFIKSLARSTRSGGRNAETN